MDAYNNNDFTHLIFFFNITPTTEIYTLSLHDALPISRQARDDGRVVVPAAVHVYQIRDRGGRRHRRARLEGRDVGGLHPHGPGARHHHGGIDARSEEHTSELQSLAYLVCRLLLEKKKK